MGQIEKLIRAYLIANRAIGGPLLLGAEIVRDDVFPEIRELVIRIIRFFIWAGIFSIVGALCFILGAPGMVTNIALGIAIVLLVIGMAIAGLSFEALKWAKLALLLAKSSLYDSQIISLRNAWKVVSSVVGWAGGKAENLIKLGASFVPWVNEKELATAFATPLTEKVVLEDALLPMKKQVEEIICEANKYAAMIKSVFITWISMLAALFIINVMGVPEFLNNAGFAFLALFLVTLAIYSTINPPAIKKGEHTVWKVLWVAALLFLLWQAAVFYLGLNKPVGDTVDKIKRNNLGLVAPVPTASPSRSPSVQKEFVRYGDRDSDGWKPLVRNFDQDWMVRPDKAGTRIFSNLNGVSFEPLKPTHPGINEYTITLPKKTANSAEYFNIKFAGDGPGVWIKPR